MILIVSSKRDPASMNIHRQLLTNYNFIVGSERFKNNPVYSKKVNDETVKLVTLNEETIYSQTITDFFNPQLIIFISRHSSKSGTPTLSVHTPGNLNEAQKGGLPQKVSIAPANAMKNALLELSRQKDTQRFDYKISYECTHHGPSLDVPTMFAELGSSPMQWRDNKAAEAVAHAVNTALTSPRDRSTVVLGIGGPHYSEKFTRIALKEQVAFGHMIPKYAIAQIDEKTISQCIERTLEKVEAVFLDWKGIRGADKAHLTEALETVGVEIKKV